MYVPLTSGVQQVDAPGPGTCTAPSRRQRQWDGEPVPDEPVMYIGLERPEGLHPDSRFITLENLRDLIPG